MNFDPKMAETYRPGVGVIVMNPQGQVIVGQRIDFHSDAWQLPQGGIDPGENPLDAAFRELGEEVGLEKADVRVIAESDEWLTYDLPDKLANKLWGGRYRGQMQKWYLMLFEGSDEKINIETEIPEFSNWQWVDFSQTIDLIVPFKQELYAMLIKEFLPKIEEFKQLT